MTNFLNIYIVKVTAAQYKINTERANQYYRNYNIRFDFTYLFFKRDYMFLFFNPKSFFISTHIRSFFFFVIIASLFNQFLISVYLMHINAY